MQLLRRMMMMHTLDKDKVVIAGSVSPKRPSPARPNSSYRHVRSYSSKAKRSGSGSSNSSDYSMKPYRSESASNLLSMNVLPASKWQRLKYLSLVDNSLTGLSAKSLGPVVSSLRSFNLSSNLFAEIPDSLASLTRLTSLDLSNCMIESLQSLSRVALCRQLQRSSFGRIGYIPWLEWKGYCLSKT